MHPDQQSPARAVILAVDSEASEFHTSFLRGLGIRDRDCIASGKMDLREPVDPPTVLRPFLDQ
jgi:hypothetical protein